MAIKVTTKLDVLQMPKNVKKRFAISLKREIVDIIVEKILSGNSPVKGQGRFEKYSRGYAAKKGRAQPVDMLLTGKMLESLIAKQNSEGDLLIEFKDKKAVWHNSGEGNQPMRKLLPSKDGEQFKRDIMRKVLKVLDKAVKKTIKT